MPDIFHTLLSVFADLRIISQLKLATANDQTYKMQYGIVVGFSVSSFSLLLKFNYRIVCLKL